MALAPTGVARLLRPGKSIVRKPYVVEKMGRGFVRLRFDGPADEPKLVLESENTRFSTRPPIRRRGNLRPCYAIERSPDVVAKTRPRSIVHHPAEHPQFF